jgi:hypothetical protein
MNSLAMMSRYFRKDRIDGSDAKVVSRTLRIKLMLKEY